MLVLRDEAAGAGETDRLHLVRRLRPLWWGRDGRTPLLPFGTRKVTSPQDVPLQIQRVLGAASRGELSLSDAERIVATLGVLAKSFETAGMAERLEALEQKFEASGILSPHPVNGRGYAGMHG
jgi:hypothetical protein